MKNIRNLFKKPKVSLHVNENIYLEAFENSGIYAKLDSSLNTIHANRQFCQIMHTTKKESLHVNFSTFLQNDKYENYYKTIVNFVKELKIEATTEYVHSKRVPKQVRILGVDFIQGYHARQTK